VRRYILEAAGARQAAYGEQASHRNAALSALLALLRRSPPSAAPELRTRAAWCCQVGSAAQLEQLALRGGLVLSDAPPPPPPALPAAFRP